MKIIPKIERHFRPKTDGFYQEVYYHLIQFIDDNGNINTRQDKVTVGGVYRAARAGEHSTEGEAIYQSVDHVEPLRLVAIRTE